MEEPTSEAVASTDQLGLPPLPDAGHYSTGPFGQSVVPWFSAAQMQTYALAERKRIAALIAQHSGLTLETLEYLETMRQGPTADEWAELDRAARA